MLLLHEVINLFAPFMNLFFSQEVEFSEASVGWAGFRLTPGWRGGGSAAPAGKGDWTETGQDQLQSSFNSFQLSVYSSATLSDIR